MTPPPTDKLKRICAWCNGVIAESPGGHHEGEVDVTHDICSACAKVHFDVKVGFEKLLPPCPPQSHHAAFRAQLIKVLQSEAELLPAAESPLGKLWELVNSEESSIDACVKLIELDPALTTRVFRLANSAAYGGHAVTTAQAVMHLGFARIRQVAFTAGILKQFSKLQLPPGWNYYWMRNLLVARLAERLAATYFPTNGTEYLAGLLHDVGWLLLSNFFPGEFTTIFTSEGPVAESEGVFLPFSHADIAAAICARSLLPLRVVNAVAHHHAPIIRLEDSYTPERSARFLGAILNVCDRMADHCQIGVLDKKEVTIKDIENSREARWLNDFGPWIDFENLIEEELPKTREVFTIFFVPAPNFR